MNSPGIFTLGDLTITDDDHEGTPVTGLAGMRRATMFLRFAIGTADSGSSTKATLKTTLDQGTTWFPVACVEFTDANAVRMITITDVPDDDSVVTPTDDPADGFVLNGYLGDRLRLDVDLEGGGYGGNTILNSRVCVA